MSKNSTNFLTRAKYFLFGAARDWRDPQIFHKLSLIAFFAWVGLGADGLSSACYGPEEAFLALQGHTVLAIFVAIMIAVTIFIITASYMQIVEVFPSGGGGYLVASKLLSPSMGMISGCALLIDYVLTITISIASGADALFSFLPYEWQFLKLYFAVLGLIALIMLNMRGVKESVVPLVPIFIIFLLTHAVIILSGFFTHLSEFETLVASANVEVARTSSQLGMVGMVLLILRAYSMGAGTYTGIEAVSNGLPYLREPKVFTARKTMMYMAGSLAFMAAGLIFCYLFFGVQHIPGKTLNAVLIEKVAGGWGGFGKMFIPLTLASEAILLFVAAQTGFLDGPRVLANMAIDRWFPSQFCLLSERFVIKNGILLMGGSAILLMIMSRGSVQFLVILYSINVFITFCLSQLGMVRHWWKERVKGWFEKLLINGVGFILTLFVLLSVIIIKFYEGGWITLVVTGSLVGVAVFIKRYYYRTQKLLKRLDKLVYVVEESETQFSAGQASKPVFDPSSRTAVILVNGFNGMGLHTLFNAVRLFGDTFKNFVFMEAGILDTGHFKGVDTIKELDGQVKFDLARYKNYLESQGYFVDTFSVVGTDVTGDLVTMAQDVHKRYPGCIFFGGQVVFEDENLLDRILYNHVTFTIQKRLHQEGIPFIVMPVKVG